MATTPKKSPKKALFVLGIVLLILLLVGGWLLIRSHSNPTNQTASQDTKGESAHTSGNSSSGSSAGNKSTNEPGDQKSSSNGSASTLLAPTGDFVSNHHPNLSGSSAPNTLTSVCQTTPGAICIISFSYAGTTKSLSSQAVDRGGAAYWNNWKLQDVGLTAGTWKITATATLNGQSKSSTDALPLEVAQ